MPQETAKQTPVFDNPMLAEWRRLSSLGNSVIERLISTYAARDFIIARYSWAIPNQAAIEIIARVVSENGLKGVIEIGAGSGYWAYCLHQVGVDVIAVDSFAWSVHAEAKKWHEVRRGGPPEAAKHPDRALMLCWPPMSSHNRRVHKYSSRLSWEAEIDLNPMYGETNMGGASLQRFRGEWVVYIGESRNGCTGDLTMWRILDTQFEEVEVCDIPNFENIRDALFVYRRKGGLAT